MMKMSQYMYFVQNKTKFSALVQQQWCVLTFSKYHIRLTQEQSSYPSTFNFFADAYNNIFVERFVRVHLISLVVDGKQRYVTT